MQKNMSGSLNGVIDEMLSGSVAGNIRFESAGGGSNVTITPTLESGTKIADFTIDQESGELYAPTPLEYTAGDNISINDGVISATDTTYTAGDGISIEDGVISALSSGIDITEITFTQDNNIITLSESFRNYEFISIYARNDEYTINNTILTRCYENGRRIGLSDDAAFQWWRIEDDTHLNLTQSGGSNYTLYAIYGLMKK